MTSFDIRHDASGAIDFDFYRSRASMLRRQARTESLRSALRLLSRLLGQAAARIPVLRLPPMARKAV